MSACLSDEEVLAFAIGRLPASRLPEAHLHFDQCETCQLLLSEAAHALATAATVPLHEDEELAWNTTFRPGTLVGQRYLIRQFITRGGMGEVYEAFDQDLQERVALKTVTSTACDSPSAVRKLKAEVQLARRVSHPNVCRTYDFGTHVMSQTGAPISFLTMEFVAGETLGQRLRLSGAVPIVEAREIGRQLLLGLDAAHDANVLHRDFKSDNVMLRSDAGDEGCPLIMDFGLARAVDQDSRQRSSSSNSTLLGTFGYIAPEQLDGKEHSKASDVYAFGVVFFEMLTGELPFESSSSPAVAVLERVRRPAVAPSSINPLVPRDLDAIVLGCLQRSPKDRYRTAGEVLTALNALEGGSQSAFGRQRALPAAVALGVVGMTLYWSFRAPPKDSAPTQVVSTLAAASPAPLVAVPVPKTKSELAAAEPLSSVPKVAPRAIGVQQKQTSLPRLSAPPSPKPSTTTVPAGPAAAAAPANPPSASFGEVSPAWENPFPSGGKVNPSDPHH